MELALEMYRRLSNPGRCNFHRGQGGQTGRGHLVYASVKVSASKVGRLHKPLTDDVDDKLSVCKKIRDRISPNDANMFGFQQWLHL